MNALPSAAQWKLLPKPHPPGSQMPLWGKGFSRQLPKLPCCRCLTLFLSAAVADILEWGIFRHLKERNILLRFAKHNKCDMLRTRNACWEGQRELEEDREAGVPLTTHCVTFGNCSPPWPQWSHLCVGLLTLSSSLSFAVIMKAEGLRSSSLH